MILMLGVLGSSICAEFFAKCKQRKINIHLSLLMRKLKQLIKKVSPLPIILYSIQTNSSQMIKRPKNTLNSVTVNIFHSRFINYIFT